MNAAPMVDRNGRFGLLVALTERDLERLRGGRLLIWNGPDEFANFQLAYFADADDDDATSGTFAADFAAA